MSRMLVLGVIGVTALLGSTPTSSAQAVEVSAPGYVVSTDRGVEATYVRFEVPSELLRASGNLDFVGVRFQADLDPGDEIELYAAENVEGMPWALKAPPARVLWVADENTGNEVRFDLTERVRAHGQEKKPLVLFVRRAPDSDGAVASLGVQKSPGLTLTVHRGTD